MGWHHTIIRNERCQVLQLTETVDAFEFGPTYCAVSALWRKHENILKAIQIAKTFQLAHIEPFQHVARDVEQLQARQIERGIHVVDKTRIDVQKFEALVDAKAGQGIGQSNQNVARQIEVFELRDAECDLNFRQTTTKRKPQTEAEIIATRLTWGKASLVKP